MRGGKSGVGCVIRERMEEKKKRVKIRVWSTIASEWVPKGGRGTG